MQAKCINNGFDVCLLEKKLKLQISTSSASPADDDKEPRKMGSNWNYVPTIKLQWQTVVVTLSIACALYVLLQHMSWPCATYSVVLACTAGGLSVNREDKIQVQLLLINLATVCSVYSCHLSQRLSLVFVLAILIVCSYELYACSSYLARLLLSVQTASVLSLSVFKVFNLFAAEIVWMEWVVIATSPVVLCCVWLLSKSNVKS